MSFTRLIELTESKSFPRNSLGAQVIKGVIIGDHEGKTFGDELMCYEMGLTSLKGSPKQILGSFNCHTNNLTTLEHGPMYVQGDYNAFRNNLTTLKGAPVSVDYDFDCQNNKLTKIDCEMDYVGNFSCVSNNITSLHNIHLHIKECPGTMRFNNNPIHSHILGLLKIKGLKKVKFGFSARIEEIINRYLPLGDLIDCQEELIEAGFARYAQL